MDTPEKKVKRKIVALLKEYNTYYFFPATGGYGRSGVPDIIVCCDGVFIGIEAKADIKKNKATALQQMNLRAIKEAGGVPLLIDANNLHELTDALDWIRSGKRGVLW